MIEFIKGLFNGSRFVNSKYLDNQFDCFIDYVDITEEELLEEIADLNMRVEEIETEFDGVLEATTELMVLLNAELEKNKKPVKVAKKVSLPKGFRKVKGKK